MKRIISIEKNILIDEIIESRYHLAFLSEEKGLSKQYTKNQRGELI